VNIKKERMKMKVSKININRYEMGDLIVDAIPNETDEGRVDYFLSVKGEFHKMYMQTGDQLSQEAEERTVVGLIAYDNKLAEYWNEYDALVELYEEPDFGEACEGCNGDGQCDDYDCCAHCESRDCLAH
jgi:MoaA/NifB/PqqE/SkfB family radical SAM enzyme